MTKKLYYEDQYVREFTADVVEIIDKGEAFHVELSETYFYPEGGGQPSDIGEIDNIKVTYVYEEGGKIYHVLDKRPLNLKEVKCKIDWNTRFDYMQQHLGQHILSACIAELYNANTCGFHLGKENVTIDIDKIISKEELDRAEVMANGIIRDNIKVEFLYPNEDEIKMLPLRKLPPETSERLRIVKIGNIDVIPCCGTHPERTGEVQVIKIKGCEKYKNLLRIEFICGDRGIKDYIFKHYTLEKISSLLSSNDKDVIGAVEGLLKKVENLELESKRLNEEIINYKENEILNSTEDIGGIRVIKNIFENEDFKYVDALASKLASNSRVIVLYGLKSQDKAQLLYKASRDIDVIGMNELLKEAIVYIDGKGGGSKYTAQGGGKKTEEIDNALEASLSKLRDSL